MISLHNTLEKTRLETTSYFRDANNRLENRVNNIPQLINLIQFQGLELQNVESVDYFQTGLDIFETDAYASLFSNFIDNCSMYQQILFNSDMISSNGRETSFVFDERLTPNQELLISTVNSGENNVDKISKIMYSKLASTSNRSSQQSLAQLANKVQNLSFNQSSLSRQTTSFSADNAQLINTSSLTPAPLSRQARTATNSAVKNSSTQVVSYKQP